MNDASTRVGGDWLAGRGSWLTTRLGPLLLVAVCPPVTLLLWVTVEHYDGSVAAAASAPTAELLSRLPAPSWTALAILLGWLGFQLLLLRALPGASHAGPVSPGGNRPQYELNGVAAFIVTHATWWLATGPLGLFSAVAVHEQFGSLLVTSSLLALVVCAALYADGLRRPSVSPDVGTTGRPLWDFYWGTQLHPRVLGVELKQLINCRFAMMGWSIIALSHAAAQVELHGHLSASMAVCVGLQVVYVFKFFVWEAGYFNSLDIMHDRFGFYICWGICAWLPIVYPIASLYLVDHPLAMSPIHAVSLLGFGLAAIALNYAADEQRQRVRASNGETKIWGRRPQLIHANYMAADGVPRQSLLLVSGWWGVARHFHYLPELALAAAWTLPVGFEHALPWLYPVYLAILLGNRSFRDDERCARKYGAAWREYRRRVPWRIVPGVF